MNITPTLYHGTARLLAVVARLGSRLLGFAVAIFALHAILALALALASGQSLGLDGAYVGPALRAAGAFAVLHVFCRLMALAIDSANRRGSATTRQAV